MGQGVRAKAPSTPTGRGRGLFQDHGRGVQQVQAGLLVHLDLLGNLDYVVRQVGPHGAEGVEVLLRDERVIVVAERVGRHRHLGAVDVQVDLGVLGADLGRLGLGHVADQLGDVVDEVNVLGKTLRVDLEGVDVREIESPDRTFPEIGELSVVQKRQSKLHYCKMIGRVTYQIKKPISETYQ